MQIRLCDDVDPAASWDVVLDGASIVAVTPTDGAGGGTRVGERVEGRRRTLLPGLIDTHVHLTGHDELAAMARLARNLEGLRRLVRELTARGVAVRFVKEQLTFTGEDTAMATLLLSVMGAFAEFERAIIGERQREGIALAKKRGVYTGRRRSLTSEQVEAVRARATAGEPKASLAREFGISRQTLYQYLRLPWTSTSLR